MLFNSMLKTNDLSNSTYVYKLISANLFVDTIGNTIMSIKKPFLDLIDFLEANKNKKVDTILQEVLLMAESKKRDTTTIKDANDNVIAIYCYYHKQWELLSEVEYGAKKSSASGYNTMCKIGVSKWTKAQSMAKKAKSQILDDLQEGVIEASDIEACRERIESDRLTIDTTDMPKGFTSEEELKTWLKG